MHHILTRHIRHYIHMSDEDLEAVLRFFEPIQVKKKQNLLTEGQVCKYHYFTAKGCLRLYFVNEKGVEQTTHFALENWWLADYTSFEKQHITGLHSRTPILYNACRNTCWHLSWVLPLSIRARSGGNFLNQFKRSSGNQR